MDQEENKLDKPQFEKRCPSISEVLGYTSVVVVLLALAIPFELKYGYSANLFNVITFSTDKNDFLFNFIRHIGLFSPSKNESKLKIFSKDDLTQFTGEDNEKPIYLAFLGMNVCFLFFVFILDNMQLLFKMFSFQQNF